MTTTHTLTLGPLSLLATQSGPLLTITIHAPSDTAPVGRMTLTVAEWTALTALVDCMGAADKEMARLRKERNGWKACAARTGTERRSDEMRAIHEADSLRQQVRELTEERDELTRVYDACFEAGQFDAELSAEQKVRAIIKERDEALADGVLSQRVCDIENDRAQLRSDLSAALVSVDAMAEGIEQMRPVYEAACEWRRHPYQNDDNLDGCDRALADAIDTAIAHTAREKAKEEK